MKNHRDVCLAREAGFAEFSGLPGKLKTGCPNTPSPNCRYCPSHTPTAFTPEGDISSGTLQYSQHRQLHQSRMNNLHSLVQKKTTRQNTFYQVWNICTVDFMGCMRCMVKCTPVKVMQLHCIMCSCTRYHVMLVNAYTTGHTNWVLHFSKYLGTFLLPSTISDIRVWEWGTARPGRKCIFKWRTNNSHCVFLIN